ncbi:hypothetical protein LVJ94_41215 [Pendulispora rubella]|uniref:Uncharacterized protein n=1 Tax=Pendulispora rubella TaxID=2741070 RepID=A0ABZ2L239_9BACT
MLPSTMISRAGVVMFSVLLCSACANTTATAPPPTSGAAEDPSLVRIQPNPTPESPPKPLSISLESRRDMLRSCLQGSSGKVNVMVTRTENTVHLGFAPDVSLDPTMRHCLLETLSTVDLEEVGGNVGGTTIKPTGYTSVIQVSW